MLKTDLKRLAQISTAEDAPYKIKLRISDKIKEKEGYKLTLNDRGVEIVAADDTGLFYGTQTLLQLFVMPRINTLPCIRIHDWPRYKLRSFMIDMGRAPYSMALIKRTIRILSRLKMNLLHLHLNDDQLCSIKFKPLICHNIIRLNASTRAWSNL